MNLQNPIIIQIAIDLALFLAIIILLWRVNVNIKRPQIQQQAINELKSLIKESQAGADKFLQVMEQSRLALKEIALKLELKEKRARAILEKVSMQASDHTYSEAIKKETAPAPPSRYSEVLAMISKGYSEEETARVTGFTRAEISLIIDLSRLKNENS